MSPVSERKRPRRGERLLLAHCLAEPRTGRPSASERLERTLGPRLARLLLCALLGPRAQAARS